MLSLLAAVIIFILVFVIYYFMYKKRFVASMFVASFVTYAIFILMAPSNSEPELMAVGSILMIIGFISGVALAVGYPGQNEHIVAI